MGSKDYKYKKKISSERVSESEWSNFPYHPEMKKFEIVDNKYKLMRLANKMKRVKAFSFDTETNTLRVAGDNKDFLCVCITISWGDYDNYYVPIHHLREEDYNRNLDESLVVKYLKPVFEREDVLIVVQNGKFDRHVLARLGINIVTKLIFDTMLASWLCDENTPNGLKENAMEKMGISAEHFKEVTDSVPSSIKKEWGLKANSKAPYSLVLIDDGAPYALADSFNTWNLYLGFVQEIVDMGVDKIFYKKYMPFSTVLYNMEERGVKVDVEKLTEMGENMGKDMDELQYKVFELAGVTFNIGSSDQKAMILYGYDKYKDDFPTYRTWWDSLGNNSYKYSGDGGYKCDKSVKDYEKSKKAWEDKQNDKTRVSLLSKSFGFKVNGTTNSGAPSTDNDALTRISKLPFKTKKKQDGVQMVKYMLEYAKLSKLKSAFVDGLLEQLYDDGRAHPSFNQIGADSGRLSCSAPNLQQLPNAEEDDKYQIRDCFVGSYNEEYGEDDHIISIDFENMVDVKLRELLELPKVA